MVSISTYHSAGGLVELRYTDPYVSRIHIRAVPQARLSPLFPDSLSLDRFGASESRMTANTWGRSLDPCSHLVLLVFLRPFQDNATGTEFLRDHRGKLALKSLCLRFDRLKHTQHLRPILHLK